MIHRLQDALERHVDPILERVLGLGVAWGIKDPIRWTLASHRRAARAATIDRFRAPAADLAAAVVAHDPVAIVAFDALLADAHAYMRALRPSEHKLLGLVESALYKNSPELLDDDAFPEERRASALAQLDRLNRALRSYDGFARALEPLVDVAASRGHCPVRVHDLAAGHGGFAIDLALRFGDRVAMEASDCKEEYLAIGRENAAKAGARVDFRVQDALALGDLEADVFVCTQSVHHFSPGAVSRLVGEAARAAKVGVTLLDAERSWLMYALVGPATALYGRSYVLWHDGLVSLRRMFYEEELALFAALAPGLPAGSIVETGTMLPAHAFLRVTRAA